MNFLTKEPINKGWSNDKKYCITDKNGTQYLLRVSDLAEHDKKQSEFNMIKQVSALGVPMCQPIEFGVCDEGVYSIQSWIDGADAEEIIPTLSDTEQYVYGLEAGRILRKIHSIPAPAMQEDWEIRFNRKMDYKIKKYTECPMKYENGQAFIDYINENRYLLKDRPQTYQHGDYHIGNMMIGSDKKLYNLLHLVNKYMDLYQAHPDQLVYKARCEKYAKIISKTIILSGMDAASFGQNAYFYDAAEGLLTATILLVAEFCEPKKRHIVSVFKIIQELLAPSGKKGKNQFQQLMELLPNDHKAKWFAGAALNTAEQSMASVMSTALSRLNAFLDSELEQILCFDTEIDAEKFCKEKSALFIIMPEENPATFFMISLIIQQLYREILAVADENGGKLKNRCVFFCDEFGTLPKIESAEMMFSASRSRRLQIVPIIQSFSQLEKNYGKEGAEIIIDNTQLTIFGGFAPQSTSAETLSKALGSCTVMSGSVSRSKNDPSESLQMIERPLMTPDELKSMPKGQFVVMKTGFYPMKVKLKLFFKWGIRFDEEHPYSVPDQGNRRVEYAEKKEIMDKIVEKYRPDLLHPPMPSDDDGGAYGGQRQVMADPEAQGGGRAPGRERARDGGVSVQTSPRNRRMPEPPVTGKTAEVKSDGQA